jgi:hypothetical protein
MLAVKTDRTGAVSTDIIDASTTVFQMNLLGVLLISRPFDVSAYKLRFVLNMKFNDLSIFKIMQAALKKRGFEKTRKVFLR